MYSQNFNLSAILKYWNAKLLQINCGKTSEFNVTGQKWDRWTLNKSKWSNAFREKHFIILMKPKVPSCQLTSKWSPFQFSSVQFSCSVMSDSLRPHESQNARPPCPSPTPGVHSNSCLSSWWCHPAISSSVVPFSSWPQSLPASGSFPMSQLFSWGGQSTGVSALASVLPMNTQE